MNSPSDPDNHSRSASIGISALPLSALAISFVLPSVRSCNGSISALSYVSDSPQYVPWIAPTYLAAAVLAATTLVPWLARRSPSRPERIAALVSLAACFGTAAATLMGFALGEHPQPTIVICCIVGTSLGVLMFIQSTRLAHWDQWQRWIASYTGFAFANVTTMFMISVTLDDANDLLFGGKIYFASLATLAVLALIGLRRTSISTRPAGLR